MRRAGYDIRRMKLRASRRPPAASLKRCALGWVFALPGLLLTACSRHDAASHFKAIEGVVVSRSAAGDLSIRLLDQDDDEPETQRCVLTNDSEIYVDGKFCPVEEIRTGDPIELLGYRDQDRFAVSLANIRRSAEGNAP